VVLFVKRFNQTVNVTQVHNSVNCVDQQNKITQPSTP